MKKMLAVFVCLVMVIVGGVAIKRTQNEVNQDCLRIHIRANSNTEQDQNIKIKVRDCVVNSLIPLIENAKDKKEVLQIIKNNSLKIKDVADYVLRENGFKYSSEIKIVKEEFPTRNYGGIIFESGEYDSVIINLGSGSGDNWWCVAYPPLCFVPNESNQVQYSSKIMEMIEKFKES